MSEQIVRPITVTPVKLGIVDVVAVYDANGKTIAWCPVEPMANAIRDALNATPFDAAGLVLDVKELAKRVADYDMGNGDSLAAWSTLSYNYFILALEGAIQSYLVAHETPNVIDNAGSGESVSDNEYDLYQPNADAYCCSVCGGYDPNGQAPYRHFPLPVGVLNGHNPDCPRAKAPDSRVQRLVEAAEKMVSYCDIRESECEGVEGKYFAPICQTCGTEYDYDKDGGYPTRCTNSECSRAALRAALDAARRQG
jgi:hypothetical protein